MATVTTTRASLEVTKGASLVEPIPVADTPSLSSLAEDDELLPGPTPTEEEWATLPRVAGRIPWTAWTVAFVEFAERFSYYGTSAVFVNFIQKDLPPGSKTGAGFLGKISSGALGFGQRASTGMTTCRAFLHCAVTKHALTQLQSTSSGLISRH
jgi:POT family proton-dependent oligopeptide transporter